MAAPASSVSRHTVTVPKESELRQVLSLSGWRKLMAVRLASQAADGVFQAGLAWLVLLSPERQQSPAALAGAAALILLPFSLLGPFTGVLLDRWSRRRVLVGGQLVRIVVVLALATLGDSAGLVVVYVLAISALAVNRFLLAAFSAGLPHVVPRRLLLAANAVTPTAGTAAVVVGLVTGSLLLGLVAGSSTRGDAGSGAVLLVACALIVLAALLALRFGKDDLGPDRLVPPAPAAQAVRRDPGSGLRADMIDVVRDIGLVLAHLRIRAAAGRALVLIGAHRLCFGLWTVQATMLTLHRDGPGDRDLTAAAVVAGCSAAGYVLAAVVTPLARARVSDRAWIASVLLASALASITATPLAWQLGQGGIAALAAAGAVIGLAAQSIKICVDTAVQRHVDDAYLGRAFSLYDVVFNVSFVLAAVAAIAVVPPDGRTWVAPAVAALGFTGVAIAYGRISWKRTDRPAETHG